MMRYKHACIIVLSLVIAALSAFTIPPNTKINIIFIGDSITHGAGLPDAGQQAPPFFATAYLKQRHPGYGFKYVNLGVSGSTTLDHLPVAGTIYGKVKAAADTLYAKDPAGLVFSIMLGTNDSAIKGPHGAPVSGINYRLNLEKIIDSLLLNYPRSKVIINYPIWYSPNTHNGSTYLQEGLSRLRTYFPEIDTLVSHYHAANGTRVFAGDKAAFNYFKKHYLTDLKAEDGRDGVFYLHPNAKGAAALGRFWGKAIDRILKR